MNSTVIIVLGAALITIIGLVLLICERKTPDNRSNYQAIKTYDDAQINQTADSGFLPLPIPDDDQSDPQSQLQ